MKERGVSYPGGTLGTEEFLHNHDNLSILQITIDYTSQIAKIPKGTLFGRQTASPGKYVPFMTLIKIASATNTTNFVATLVTAAEAGCFTITTDKIKLWDTSAGALVGQPSTGNALTVDAVDASAGTVTCTGETVDTTPAEGDYLVIIDGSEDPANIVLLLEEIDFSSLTKDPLVSAVMRGNVKREKVLRLYDDHTTPNLFFDESKVQTLKFYKAQL